MNITHVCNKFCHILGEDIHSFPVYCANAKAIEHFRADKERLGIIEVVDIKPEADIKPLTPPLGYDFVGNFGQRAQQVPENFTYTYLAFVRFSNKVNIIPIGEEVKT